MLIYISSVKAPPNKALQGRLTQLVEEDDGICVIGIAIGMVVGIAIGIAWSGAEDAPAEMTADCISRWSWMMKSQL
jgi:hypothetical protein